MHVASQRFLDLAGQIEAEGQVAPDVICGMLMAALDATRTASKCSHEVAQAMLTDLINRIREPVKN